MIDLTKYRPVEPSFYGGLWDYIKEDVKELSTIDCKLNESDWRILKFFYSEIMLKFYRFGYHFQVLNNIGLEDAFRIFSSYCSSKFVEIIPELIFLKSSVNSSFNILPYLENTESSERDFNFTNNGMIEQSPINANLGDIETPSGKSNNTNSGNETNTNKNPKYLRENMDWIDKHKITIVSLMEKFCSSIIIEHNLLW